MNTAKPMYEWNTIPWHQLDKQVFKLQKRIYQASERGEVKVVRRLQKLLISSWSAKAIAVRKVTQDNQGRKTAGVNGIKSLTPKRRMELVKNLRLEDKSKPTRRIWIPKLGKAKKRLGIPIINERAKHALIEMALEPEWEAKFESNSFGFRPGRSCHDAIGAIHKSLARKAKYILNADISKCFGKIDHQKLLKKINTFPILSRQIKTWLKLGVIDKGTLFPTDEETPYAKRLSAGVLKDTTSHIPFRDLLGQGGIRSPLLANIALHGMENLIRESFPNKDGYKNGIYWSSPTPNLIRYADNFVILHKDIEVIRQCKSLIETWLRDIGLELKPEKTRISHSLEKYEGNVGFDFLSFHIQHFHAGKYKSGRSSKRRLLGHKLLIKPSRESIQKHLKKIEEVIDRHRASKTEKIISLLNPIIREWSNYFKGAISSETFKLLDHLTYLKLRRWANRRHPNKGKKWVKNKYWKSIFKRNWVFLETYENEIIYTLTNHADTKIIRHVKVKGNKSPYDGDFIYWSQRLSTYPETSTKVKTLLKKRKGECTICKMSFTSQDILEVDHIKLRSQGAKDTYKNIQLLHRHCHDNKSRQKITLNGTNRSIHVKNHLIEERSDEKLSCCVL